MPIEYVSKSVKQFGYCDDDFTSGRVSWFGIIHPDDVQRLGIEIEHYAIEGMREFTQEYRLITKYGAIRWIEDRTMAILDSKGKITLSTKVSFLMSQNGKQQKMNFHGSRKNSKSW